MEGFIQFAPRAVIVDDEPAIREYVAMVARQAGFEVDLASSGTELIDHLAEPFPHIIVLDLNMAHTDGVQVMRELARRKIDSRIVIFSGGAKGADEKIFDECKGIRDGGGFGSIIGRNSFQRKKPDALKFLDQVMKIYAG